MHWLYDDRFKTYVHTCEVNFMYGCIYGLIRSHALSHGLARQFIRSYTDMTSVPGFQSFKKHTRLSRIHSNSPSVTRIRLQLVRLYVRLTRVANRVRVCSVLDRLRRTQHYFRFVTLTGMAHRCARCLVCMKWKSCIIVSHNLLLYKVTNATCFSNKLQMLYLH